MIEEFIDDILLKFTNDTLAQHEQAPLKNIVDANKTSILWGARRALAVFTLRPIEIVAEMLWKIDYPNGGSIVKKWNDNNFRDKELYRSKAKSIMTIDEATRAQPKYKRVDLETLKRVHPIRDRANGVYSSASYEVDGYNRAIDEIKSKFGDLYVLTKEGE